MPQQSGHHIKSSTEKLEVIQRCTARFVVSDYHYSSSVTSILSIGPAYRFK